MGNNTKEINNQIKILKEFYDDIEFVDESKGIFLVRFGVDLYIQINIEKYPKKPIINISPKLMKVSGKPNKFLNTFASWKKNKPPNIIDIIHEFQNFLAFFGLGTAKLIISEEFIAGILKISEDLYPQAFVGLLRQNHGIINEYVLPSMGMQINMVKAEEAQFVSPLEGFDISIWSDTSIIGWVRSYSQSLTNLTETEKMINSKFIVNMSVFPPFNVNCIDCFDRKHNRIPFKLI